MITDVDDRTISKYEKEGNSGVPKGRYAKSVCEIERLGDDMVNEKFSSPC